MHVLANALLAGATLVLLLPSAAQALQPCNVEPAGSAAAASADPDQPAASKPTRKPVREPDPAADSKQDEPAARSTPGKRPAPPPRQRGARPAPEGYEHSEGEGEDEEAAELNARENYVEARGEDLIASWSDLADSRLFAAFRLALALECVSPATGDDKLAQLDRTRTRLVLNVKLNETKFRKMCAELQKVLEYKLQGRVMIWMDEYVRYDLHQREKELLTPDRSTQTLVDVMGDPLAESHAGMEINRVLREYGFDVQCKQRHKFLKQQNQERAFNSDDDKLLRLTNRDFGAPLYAVGHATAHPALDNGQAAGDPPLQSFATTSRLEIHSSATGKVLTGVKPQSAQRSSAFAGEKGAIDGLQQTGRQLGREAARALVMALLEIARHGEEYTVQIRGDGLSAARETLLREFFPKQEADLEITQASFSGGAAVWSVRTHLSRAALQKLLTSEIGAGVELRLVEGQGDAIELKLVER
ncbi:hypothetical protein RAS1_14930 [Phycisphaerae bacterium RAS1]|nr:hypothetical protein RAS1_14930 [Phycisphaerae bacterium RAS1]